MHAGNVRHVRRLEGRIMRTAEGNFRSVPGRRVGFVLVLAALCAALAAVVGPGAAFAGAKHQRSADVTFTKWIVVAPPLPSTNTGAVMAGVVGGDVGRGRYAGLVLGDDTTTQPGFWLGHARYEFRGRKHFFAADLHITENDTVVPVTATIEGVVTTGWMKGAHVTGQYRQWEACPIPTPGNVFGIMCYQGTLHLQYGHRR
jgi:hypothetical protein